MSDGRALTRRTVLLGSASAIAAAAAPVPRAMLCPPSPGPTTYEEFVMGLLSRIARSSLVTVEEMQADFAAHDLMRMRAELFKFWEAMADA